MNITKYKGLNTNDVTCKDGKKNEEGKKQQRKTTKM